MHGEYSHKIHIQIPVIGYVGLMYGNTVPLLLLQVGKLWGHAEGTPLCVVAPAVRATASRTPTKYSPYSFLC